VAPATANQGRSERVRSLSSAEISPSPSRSIVSEAWIGDW
jgi:hypothetical protein